jgi:predicted Zn-dependent protease
MQFEWKGFYLDGVTAARQQASIRLLPDGLEVTTERGATSRWPYHEIRQTQGFYTGEQIRLERGGPLSEALLITDPAILTDLHRFVPGLQRRFHNPARRAMRIRFTIYAAIAAVGGSIALYVWGIPALVTVATPLIPVSWEEQMGNGVVQQLAPVERQCRDPSLTTAIEKIETMLIASRPEQPYKFRIMVVNNPVINAFAAPGGYIVVFRGLLERTQTAEELAGVLAHETQHVLHRHVTQALLQRASTGLLIAAMTGDASGAMAYGLKSAGTLGQLRYSRLIEEEADRDGMRMLIAAKIDSRGMIAFFEMLEKEEHTTPAFLTYLSTHPATGDRIEKLRALAGIAPNNPVKLLPNDEWSVIRKRCTAQAS